MYIYRICAFSWVLMLVYVHTYILFVYLKRYVQRHFQIVHNFLRFTVFYFPVYFLKNMDCFFFYFFMNRKKKKYKTINLFYSE